MDKTVKINIIYLALHTNLMTGIFFVMCEQHTLDRSVDAIMIKMVILK